MRKQGCCNASEDERRRAVEMVVGDRVATTIVAKTLGRSRRTIQDWVKKSAGGRKLSALRTRKAPGAKPKLTKRQKNRLLRMLEAGPQTADGQSQLWTGPRIARLIQLEFGVTYHSEYIPKLLKSWGWSVQKPKRRAVERNDAVVEQWVCRDWPRIKKKPAN